MRVNPLKIHSWDKERGRIVGNKGERNERRRTIGCVHVPGPRSDAAGKGSLAGEEKKIKASSGKGVTARGWKNENMRRAPP